MITLSILRHAKSSWDYPDLSDFDRPLRNKGIKRTQKVCTYLLERKIEPDLVLSSKAIRAMDTAKQVVENLNLEKSIIQGVEDFYPGSTSAFFNAMKQTDVEVNHLMVVGHNPSITDFANQLLVNKVIDWVPTSGLILLNNNADSWQDVQFKEWNLEDYIIPKQI